MRPGQHQNNKRMRGRNRGKGPNPLNRSYESNGPDVKIRGSAQHIAEKYLQLARDAQGSGDRVMAENYMQHAEHYFRLLAAAQAQFAPHLPAYVRPDEQSLDDEEEFEETEGQVAAQGGEQPGVPVPQQPGQGGYQQQPGGEERREREFRPRWERGERGERQDRFDRGGRGERYDRRDRQDRPDRFQAGERTDGGEQPSVEFPERPREQSFEPRPPRPERGPRPDRPPRPERSSEIAASETANGEVAPEATPIEAEEGREPGLPSFLTRGRRRGRPPYRRREEGEEAAEQTESAASEEASETAAPPPAAAG